MTSSARTQMSPSFFIYDRLKSLLKLAAVSLKASIRPLAAWQLPDWHSA